MPNLASALLMLAVLPLPILAQPGHADRVTDSMARVLRDLDAVSAADMDRSARVQAFLSIVEAAFDLDHMAGASLRQDRSPGPAAWADYRLAYRAHVTEAFLQKLDTHGPTRSTPLGIRIASDGARVFAFQSTAGLQSLRIGWVLCDDDALRVCDIEAFGLRASTWQSLHFAHAVATRGWEGFLADLARGALVPPG